MSRLPDRTIERISGYRRRLRSLLASGHERVFSHELAANEGVTPAQVRRDLMTIGYTGSPAKGYGVKGLIERIDTLLDPPSDEGVAVVGVGRLGKAFLAYFASRPGKLPVVAAFDRDPDKVGRLTHGCPCYSTDEIESVLSDKNVTAAFVTTPAEAAQEVTDRLIRAGVRGLINLAPVRLQVPPGVYVEDLDITVSLDKAAYFARHQPGAAGRSA